MTLMIYPGMLVLPGLMDQSFPEFKGRGWSDLAGEISVCTKSFTHTLTAISLDWRRFILPKIDEQEK